MNEDKTRYDVMTHLTDIPMLGKQYVPQLWRQFESGSVMQNTMSPRSTGVQEPVNERNVIPTTSVQQTEKENGRAQSGGFYRLIDKRALETPSDVVSDSSPLPKMGRFEKR